MQKLLACTKLSQKQVSKNLNFQQSFLISLQVNRRPIIETAELAKIFDFGNVEKVKVLNASYNQGQCSNSIFQKERIKGAQFFDFTNVISDKSSGLTNMLPNIDVWQENMRKFDISKNDPVVIYDDFGIMGACRAYWMFSTYNHFNVYVLNGSFQKWKKDGYEVEQGNPTYQPNGPTRANEDYLYRFRGGYVSNLQQIQEASVSVKNLRDKFEIIDARPPNKYKESNIPGAKNIFQKQLLNDDYTFKSNQELQKIFDDNQKVIINHCQTGVSACVLYVAQEALGVKRKTIYDGSWAEFSQAPPYDEQKILSTLEKPISTKFYPITENLQKDSFYSWCSCGRTKHSPFCDGSHVGTDFRPIKFTVDADKTVKICQCKYSKTKPYCSGNHVRAASSYLTGFPKNP